MKVFATVTIFSFLYFFHVSSAINCAGGFYSERIQPIDPINVTCSSESNMCIRIDAYIRFFGVHNQTNSAYGCANESSCALACPEANFRYSKEYSPDSDFKEKGILITYLSCTSICCSGDLCNNQTIDQIRDNINQQLTTPPAPETTAPTEPNMSTPSGGGGPETTTGSGAFGLLNERSALILSSIFSIFAAWANA